MSPRRRVDGDFVATDYFTVTPMPVRRWGLTLVTVTATLVTAAAIAASVFMFVEHESDRRDAVKEAAALGYAREFMTMYMTLDRSMPTPMQTGSLPRPPVSSQRISNRRRTTYSSR